MKKLYLLLFALIACVSSASAVDLYLRGSQPGWEAQSDDTYKFTQSGDIYTLNVASLSGEFKIAAIITTGNTSWDNTANYGPSTNTNVDVNQNYTVVCGAEAKNFKALNTLTDITITLNTTNMIMRIEGQSTESTITYVLNGQFTNSNWSQTPMTEKTDGKWGVTLTPTVAQGAFGVMQKANDIQSGYWKGGEELTEQNPTVTLTEDGSAHDTRYALSTQKSYDFTFDPATGVLSITFEGEPTPIEYPEQLYVVGYVNNGEFVPNNTVTLPQTATAGVYEGSVTFTGASGTADSYFQLATAIGSDTEDWNGLGTRYGAETRDAVAGETPSTITLTGDRSWKIGVGTYTVTANLVDMTLVVRLESQPVDPDPVYPELGIIGTMQPGSGWDLANPIAMTRNENIYTATFETMTAGTLFKVAIPGSDWTQTWGAEGTPEVVGPQDIVIEPGVEVNAFKNYANNFKVENTLTDVTITFTYVADGPSKIKIEGTADTPAPVYPELGIIGTMQPGEGWDLANPIAMTRNENIYTATFETMTAGTLFKVAIPGSDWTQTWGAEGAPGVEGPQDIVIEPGVEVNAFKNYANNFKVENTLTDVTITFTYIADGPSKIKIEGTTDYSTWLINVFGPFNSWADNGIAPVDGITKHENLAIGTQGFKVKVWNGIADTHYCNVYPVATDEWVTVYKDELDLAPMTIEGATESSVYNVEFNCINNTIRITEVGGQAPTDLDGTFDFVAIAGTYPESDWIVDPEAGTSGNTYINVTDRVFNSNDFTAVATRGEKDACIYKVEATGAIDYRFYNGSTLTVTAPAGYYITEITLSSSYSDLISNLSATNAGADWTKADATPAARAEGSGCVFTPATTGAQLKSIAISTTATTHFETINCKSKKISTGIESIVVEDEDAPVEYYNLQGVRVDNPANGIYIRRQGNKASKVIIR